ncbi:hypothetical protein HZC09_04040 [Candidatus Micrarchaeota archaeon]|nr:hypothetical protein [Candidatus Micrarchaeota archaeon]
MVDEILAMTIGFSAIAVILLVRNTYLFERKLTREAKHLEDMLLTLENQALELKTEVQDLGKTLNRKTDHGYLDKRIDGLVQLIKTK